MGGFIGDGDFGDSDVDLYRFALQEGETLSAGVDALFLDGTSHLRLFDSTGAELLSDESVLNFVASSSGAYYLGVSGAPNTDYDPDTAGSGLEGGTGAYNLHWNITSA